MAEATVGRTAGWSEVRDDLTRGRGPAVAGPRDEYCSTTAELDDGTAATVDAARAALWP